MLYLIKKKEEQEEQDNNNNKNIRFKKRFLIIFEIEYI